MKARKQDLIGRKIVDVDFRPFPHWDYPDKLCHNPVLILDNGRRVWFITQETGGSEYGTSICINGRDRRLPDEVRKRQTKGPEEDVIP